MWIIDFKMAVKFLSQQSPESESLQILPIVIIVIATNVVIGGFSGEDLNDWLK